MPDHQSLENSPLEIYETAYRLHYIDNRISEALKYYEILIKEFPDSNECGYAAVQIQKIKAGGLIKEINKSSKSIHPAAVAGLIISIISLLFSASVSYYFYTVYSKKQHRVELILSALSKVYIGDVDEALKVLTELKISDKNDILPFELSSDLYKKLGRFEQASSEYEIFFRLNPSLKPSGLQLEKMQGKSEQQAKIRQVPVQTVARDSDTVNNDVNESSIRTPPKNSISDVKLTKNPIPAQKRKQIKGLYLVNPDSISYF